MLALLGLVPAFVLALLFPAGAASAPKPYVWQGPVFSVDNGNAYAQAIELPTPAGGSNPIYCVVVNGSDSGGGSGAGVSCDWQNFENQELYQKEAKR